ESSHLVEPRRRLLRGAVHDHLDLVELVTALYPAHIAACTHVLAPEARRVCDVASRQSRGVQDLVPVQPNELWLRGGEEPHVIVFVAVQVLMEVRKGRTSDERLESREERRAELRETGGGLEVDHPSDERTLQSRARPA